ncbi:hypothetical protein D3C87_1898130 [compost metagenome]
MSVGNFITVFASITIGQSHIARFHGWDPHSARREEVVVIRIVSRVIGLEDVFIAVGELAQTIHRLVCFFLRKFGQIIFQQKI